MLFSSTAIAQMKTLSDDSLNHSCTITDEAGEVYDGDAQVYDDQVQISRMAGGDASFDAQALIRLPHQSHADWSRKDVAQDAVITATYEGVTQTGRVTKVMRKQAMCFVGVNWLDQVEFGTIGTISDLTVMGNGAGSVALVFTPAPGATSHQAQVGGVNSGSAVDGETGIIVLSGLSAGSKAFRVVASDGSTTTNSNAVNHVVT